MLLILHLLIALLALGPNGSFGHYPTDNRSPPTVAKLAFCGDAALRDASRRLLYVSTLDGSVTALDLTEAGRQRWSLQTGPATLLSSSIHRFELTNDGRMVRMIPSLYGGLYKFDGDVIEQIPVTAEHLLSSSYKFSDDLVIAGGKETRSYGVSVRTGRVVYECSMSGCRNHTAAAGGGGADAAASVEEDDDGVDAHNGLLDDVVVVRRETQTVRAVEPRTGGERWNFSVGHHELELLKPHDCRQTATRLNGADAADAASGGAYDSNRLDGELELRVLVPDGLVCAVRSADPSVVVWRHQFAHPIVNAWRVNGADEMVSVNLFSMQSFAVRQPHAADADDDDGDEEVDDEPEASQRPKRRRPSSRAVHPSVYVGMYQRQLYIQEADNLKRALLEHQFGAPQEDGHFLTIPWKPQYALATLGHGNSGEEESTAVSSSVIDVHDDRATALSLLYATEYVNGNGFYLYSSADLVETSLCNKRNDSHHKHHSGEEDDGTDGADDDDGKPYDFPFDDDDTPTKIIIVSLWFWWKEIMVISLTTALILNVVLSRRLSGLGPREVVIVERHIEVPVPMPMPIGAIVEINEAADDSADEAALAPLGQRSRTVSQQSTGTSEAAQQQPAVFVSRYQTDFEMVQCLGKGGFGVVFESKNKLDDCRYAIKRIQLPMRQESRDRVMREVKTLAHCEHQNIVRYFQAWVETPPPGWQEQEDRIWMQHAALSHSVDIDSPTMDDETEEASRSIVTSPSVSASALRNAGDSVSHVVFSKVINRRDHGLDSWITNLNTNECLNFDEFNRKTSFVRCDETTTEKSDDDDDDDDNSIQFRDDDDTCTEDDVVFADDPRLAAKATRKLWQRQTTDRSITNDSFQIVFQNPTTMSSTSGGLQNHDQSTTNGTTTTNGTSENSDTHDGDSDDDEEDDDDDDSFRIEFKHTSGDGAGDCIDGPIQEAYTKKKQRTISESIPSSSAAAGSRTGACLEPAEPFRKTHRRPLSLDLSAAVAECRRKRDAAVALNAANRMYLYIQMQLCKKQSLKDWLRINDLAARRRDISSIFGQIVDGVEYCHLKGLIHRDLKPGNIFFALDGQIKIGDFGLVTGMPTADMPATPCGGNDAAALRSPGVTLHTQQVGTQLYMSPEQLNGEQYCYKVDVFSLGLIFFELLRVFGTEMERIETLKGLRLGRFPADFVAAYPDEYNLLKLMLSHSPDERPTTIGIRARPPLGPAPTPDGAALAANAQWHFALPPRRRDSDHSRQSLNGSDSLSGSGSTMDALQSRHKKVA